MLTGTAQITAVDQFGRRFVDNVGPGDLWYFHAGIPHSIQGLEPDGCEFILAFDDRNFSEFDTFSIRDWAGHTPKMCWRRISPPRRLRSPLSPASSCISSRATSSPRSRPRSARPAWCRGPSASAWVRSNRTARREAAACASPTRTVFPYPPRSPRRWWRWSRVACVSCTGIRMPTNGSSGSAAMCA